MNEEVINEEVIEETEENVEENTEEVIENDDDEFEYDEEGNIIIPDVVYDDEEEEEAEEPSEEEEAEELPESSTEQEEAPKADENEKNSAPDPKDEEIARLKRRLADYESQAKDTVKKLGGKDVDAIDGLAQLAADAEGVSLNEYKTKRENERLAEEARATQRSQKFEAIAAADIAELHATYPETKQYNHVKDLPKDILRKFATFRDRGLTAKEAYAAANPDGIRTNVATAVKTQVAHQSKEHLKSSAPKSSKNNAISMSRTEIAEWRELFPGKSDQEIYKLYKQTL